MPVKQFNNIPVATIDPVFLGQILALKEEARRIYFASLSNVSDNDVSNINQRRWQVPPVVNVLSPGSIGAGFDRADINAIYIRALTKGPKLGLGDNAPEGEGRIADCQAEKIQLDYLAAQERAFRMRHATSVRCTMHAANRRWGHSSLNDAAGQLTSLGAGIAPAAGEVTGPIGGIFTSMIRYLYLIVAAGYNEGPIEINTPSTVVVQLPDGTVLGQEAAVI